MPFPSEINKRIIMKITLASKIHDKIILPIILFSLQKIEESMIAANICAAKFIKKNIGFGIYRVHEEPDFIKVDNLKKFFSLKGYSSKALSNPIDQINSFIQHLSLIHI